MPGNVIAIANQKGGVGKTTTAINTAHYLQKSGHSVLVVDIDPQGNTTSGLGLDKHGLEYDVYHALLGVAGVDQVVKPTAHNVALLPASPVLAVAEVELVEKEGREFRLRRLLDQLSFDYVLIDCPPSLGLLTINGLTAADNVVIPVQTEYYAMEGVGQLLQTIELVKQGLNPNLRLLGVLMTMHNTRTTLASQVHDEIHKHFPGQVFESIIPRNVRLAEAPSFGQPIHDYDKRSKGARAYRKFARELVARIESNGQ